MNPIRRTLLAAATVLLAAPLLHAQASESAITKQIGKLRSLSPEQRSIATAKLAQDIRTLPAGPDKVNWPTTSQAIPRRAKPAMRPFRPSPIPWPSHWPSRQYRLMETGPQPHTSSSQNSFDMSI